MKIINYDDMLSILKGSTILCAGGGGSFGEALEITKDMESFKMAFLNEMNGNDMVFTVFAVGNLKAQEEFNYAVIKKSVSKLESMLNIKFNAVIPVEVGPISIVQSAYVASRMNIPLLDADVVGGRSAPEIFLETITLGDINRTPLIAVNDKDEEMILNKKSTSYEIELILREFASRSNGCAYVIGYPMRISEIKNIIEGGTISLCSDIGDLLNSESNVNNFPEKLPLITGCRELFRGKITDLKMNDNNGFSSGEITIQKRKNKFKILFKNENIACWFNDKLLLTIPDIICVFSPKDFRGLCNCEIRPNEDVLVLGIPSIDIWKTQKGLSVFNPRMVGFNIDTKIFHQ